MLDIYSEANNTSKILINNKPHAPLFKKIADDGIVDIHQISYVEKLKRDVQDWDNDTRQYKRKTEYFTRISHINKSYIDTSLSIEEVYKILTGNSQ